ncbi:secreted RxLR effector protein 161-like [Monomorium pharaonis]|uniref:secreted RxLR effector protein 161-like n=1 Tax=Monomorium pharaonis TaxID=307658 RepID=UPI0017461299|nr:secreted RxLR effector protein 161-like [Monomorium pharaonis]
MNDLGEPQEFLGMTIKRDKENKHITIVQEKYIDKILKRFGIEEMHPQRTPMITNQVANRERKLREESYEENILNETETLTNVPYKEAVGSLLYLAGATRPDIAFAVNMVSRHQINPTEQDWKMIIRIFRYLKGTKKLGLSYTAKRNDLQAFSDASFADCKGSVTTSGYIIQLYGDTISWKTHKQNYVALSTCQAEYVAMSKACKELVAMSQSLKRILYKSPCPMQLWCDNKVAEASTKISGGSTEKNE